MTNQPTHQRELRLMRQMAWRNLNQRRNEEFCEKYSVAARRLLMAVAALDYFMEGLRSDLEKAGKYIHEAKRAVNGCLRLTALCNGRTDYELGHIAEADTEQMQYKYTMNGDIVAMRIEKNTLIEGIERNYSIVMALVRAVKRYNDQLTRRYLYPPALALYDIPRRLECLKLNDCKQFLMDYFKIEL